MSRFVVLFLLAAGCGRGPAAAPVGTNRWTDTPKDSAQRCEEICKDLGLGLGAVVVMANNVGCVCNAPSPAAPAQTPTAGASTAGGMATIMLQQEEDARRRRNSSSSSSVGIKHL